MRPDESWRMCRRRAEVGEAFALPTPTPDDVRVYIFRWRESGTDLGVRLWRRGGRLLSCRMLGGSPETSC